LAAAGLLLQEVGHHRELLECAQGIRHFKLMLERRQFTLYMDHKPLTHTLSKGVEP
jgi:hypothetical protein